MGDRVSDLTLSDLVAGKRPPAVPPDIARVKGNIQKMIGQDAPEADIDAYLASEGVSLEQLQTPAAPVTRERTPVMARIIPRREPTTANLNQMAYDAGGSVTDWTGSPALGAVANTLFSIASTGPAGGAVKGAAMAGKAGALAVDETANAVRAAGTAARAAAAEAPKIIPETIKIARKANSFGIPLRPDMLTDNRFVKIIGEALDKVPLSGSTGEARQVAFNRALGSLVGAEKSAPRLTGDVFNAAMNQSGKAIGDIAAKSTIPEAAVAPIHELAAVAEAGKETSETARIVNHYAKELTRATKDGQIEGTLFRKIRSELTDQMRTSVGDIKRVLSDVDDAMLDAIQGQLTKEEIKQFSDARRQYAIGKVLEPLVAKSPRGDISPTLLMGRVNATTSGKSAMARGKAGDLGDLAKIGQLFLKEPGSSNTAERAAAYGVLGGSMWAHPAIAGTVYGAANIYNRAGPAIARRIIGGGGLE